MENLKSSTLIRTLAKSSTSELSVFEGRWKSRNSSSSSFEFPENLFDFATSSTFLRLGHFFNSKTREKRLLHHPKKMRLHPFYKRQSSLPRHSSKNQKKFNLTAKHGVFGIKWNLCHQGMRWARALYPGESRFLATANQRWSYNLRRIRAHCNFRGFFFQGALHDNGLTNLSNPWQNKQSFQSLFDWHEIL